MEAMTQDELKALARHDADATFIAAAKSAIPTLIKELREARAMADKLAEAAKAIMPPLMHPEVSCWKDVHAALEAWKARKEQQNV